MAKKEIPSKNLWAVSVMRRPAQFDGVIVGLSFGDDPDLYFDRSFLSEDDARDFANRLRRALRRIRKQPANGK